MDKRQPRKVFVVDHKTGRMARLNMSKKLADPPINKKKFSVIDTISYINGVKLRGYLFKMKIKINLSKLGDSVAESPTVMVGDKDKR